MAIPRSATASCFSSFVSGSSGSWKRSSSTDLAARAYLNAGYELAELPKVSVENPVTFVLARLGLS